MPAKAGRGIELTAERPFAPALFPIHEELRLCEARRCSSYNNRRSDHVVQVEGGRLQFRLQGDVPLTADAAVNDGQWHYAVTAVSQTLYLDGKLVGTGKLARRTRASTRLGLDLGPGGGAGTVAFDGVRILGSAPTAADAAKLFADR